MPVAPPRRPRALPGSARGRAPDVVPPRLQGDDGSALAELALILPFLAVIVLGCLDIGRGFALKNRLANMSREGAMRAQYYPTNIAPACTFSITAAAVAEDANVANPRVRVFNADTGAEFTNTTCGDPPPAARRVRVEVAAPMLLYTPFAGSLVGSQVWVRGSTTVALQR